MKKLTDADYAILKARGKVKSLTTVRDNIEKQNHNNHHHNHPFVGQMIHTSWGYNMTINNFAKIIEVSPTGKTIVCQRLTKEGFNGFAGMVKAGNDTFGPKFRLKIKDGWNGSPSFVGSYPYHGGETKEDSSYRKGYFTLYNGEEVYENHMD